MLQIASGAVSLQGKRGVSRGVYDIDEYFSFAWSSQLSGIHSSLFASIESEKDRGLHSEFTSLNSVICLSVRCWSGVSLGLKGNKDS